MLWEILIFFESGWNRTLRESTLAMRGLLSVLANTIYKHALAYMSD